MGPLTGKSGQMFLTVTFCVCEFLFFFLLILLSYVVVFDGKLLILIKWLHSIDEGVGWLMKAYINYTTGSSFHSFFVELKCFCILNVVVFKGVFVFFTPNTLGFIMIWTVTVCVILFLELKRKTNFGVAQATLLFRGEKKKSWFLVYVAQFHEDNLKCWTDHWQLFGFFQYTFVHNIQVYAAMVKVCSCCSCSPSQTTDLAALWQSAKIDLACKEKDRNYQEENDRNDRKLW